MGNFDFVRQTLPSLHDDCARAESYLSSDPRSACFYSRRVVEELVGYLYDVLSLSLPYRDDLAAKINDAAFKAKVPQGITQKLTAIRRIANTAEHENRQIRPDVSLAVLRVRDDVIVLQTMMWPDEIRRPDFGSLDTSDAKPQEVKMAQMLVETLAGDFEPDEYEDDYREAVESLVRAKIEGGEVKRTAPEPKGTGEVVDLLAALQRSVDAAKRARGEDVGEDVPDAGSTETDSTEKAAARTAKKTTSKSKKPAKKTAGASQKKSTGSAKTSAKKKSTRKAS